MVLDLGSEGKPLQVVCVSVSICIGLDQMVFSASLCICIYVSSHTCACVHVNSQTCVCVLEPSLTAVSLFIGVSKLSPEFSA